MEIQKEHKKIFEKAKGSKAIVGLSVGKPIFYNKEKMTALANFLDENFSESLFYIADLPKKYNLMAIDGCTEEEAIRKVSQSSHNLKSFLGKICKNLSSIKISTHMDLSSDTYFHNLKILTKAYKEHSEFRNLCREGVKGFLESGKNARKISKDTIEDTIDIAIFYRLEELAMLLAITHQFNEHICELYPGTDTLHEMLQGKKFNFCPEMFVSDERSFVEVIL